MLPVAICMRGKLFTTIAWRANLLSHHWIGADKFNCCAYFIVANYFYGHYRFTSALISSSYSHPRELRVD